MGLYLGLYLGPYVKCVARPQTHEVDVWGCTNVKCTLSANRGSYQPPDKKFCSECGSPCGTSKKTAPYRPYPHTVLGDSEELTMLGDKSNTYYLGSNVKSPRRFHCDADEGAHLDVAEIDREAEMKWFRERHAADLVVLGGVYDTHIGWGLHAWYS